MSNDYLTPEQIEEMLMGSGRLDSDIAINDIAELKLEDYLSQEEVDVLGEIGNISMGTSATTLFSMLGRKVTITTPRTSVHTLNSLQKEYPAPIVVVEVSYTEGIDGNNLLLLKEYDVALITDLLMGGEGDVDESNLELDEIHLSAIREVMNQMVGSSATSMANILGKTVNISTPSTKHILLSDDSISDMFAHTDILVRISFLMEIEGLLKSDIMQIVPLSFAKSQVEALLNAQNEESNEEVDGLMNSDQAIMVEENNYSTAHMVDQPSNQFAMEQSVPSQQYAPPPPPPPQPQSAPQPQYGYMPQQPQFSQPQGHVVRHGVQAQTVQYPTFDAGDSFLGIPMDHIGMIMDVPMKVTVQLGKAKKKIKEIMELNTGSVIVLDKLAGESVEVLVNGILIAKGEVVVVDDNYGVRITEINIPEVNKNVD